MNTRLVSALAAAAVAGGGAAGSAYVNHIEHRTRTVASVAPAAGCTAHVRLWEDGSYSAGKVSVDGMFYADTFTIEPTYHHASFLRQVGTGPVELVTEWPVNSGNRDCTFVVDNVARSGLTTPDTDDAGM